MIIFLNVAFVIVCISLIVVVLLQRGKGAEIGAVFGGGGGATVFGSRGPATFLTKLTTVLAVLFMVLSGALYYLGQQGAHSSLFNQPAKTSQTKKAPPSPFTESAPAKPAPQAEKPSGSSGFKEVKPPPPAKTGQPPKP